MKLKTLRDTNLQDKLVLYRAPYDIQPLHQNHQLILEDQSRLRATLPTIKYLLQNNCRLVILTWVGRPHGQKDPYLTTTPHAQALSSLLNQKIKKINHCLGSEATRAVSKLKPKEILMLENVRFYPQEEQNSHQFAQKLTHNYDLCVFDAFPQAHRIAASTTGIQKYLPTFAGLYLEKEYLALSRLATNPQPPFTIIIGGAKISDKIKAIKNLLSLADTFLVGGAVANVFLKAQGKNIASSLVKNRSQNYLKLAQEILSLSPSKIKLPLDLIITNNLQNPTSTKIITTSKTQLIPPHWAIVDIGPLTQKVFSQIIKKSQTIFWNGPLGLTTNNLFTSGSKAILKTISQNKNTTIIAGGSTVALVNKFSQPEKFTFTSLGGGATLRLLANKPLPALDPLLRK